jgi:hypothetical protein
LDPETIAAFLDGRLSAAERDRVLNELARSPEHYETMVEAAAIQRERAGGKDTTHEPFVSVAAAAPEREAPARRWRLRRPVQAAVLAMAALLAGLLVLPTVITRKRSSDDVLSLVRGAEWFSVARRQGAAQSLGPNWSRINWPASRSAQPTASATRSGFRAGLDLVNLKFAIETRDSVSVAATAADLSQVLGNVPGAGPAAAQLEQLRREPASAQNEAAASEFARTMRDLFAGSAWFALGAWLGQARLAAAAGDLSLFTPGSPAFSQLTSTRDQLAAEVRLQNDGRAEGVLNELSSLINAIQTHSVNDTAAASQHLQSIVQLAGEAL